MTKPRKLLLIALKIVLALFGVSIICGLTDFALIKRGGTPVFSKKYLWMTDGGTADFRGFCYTLRVWHTLDGLRGPELTYWWFPFYSIKSLRHEKVVIEYLK